MSTTPRTAHSIHDPTAYGSTRNAVFSVGIEMTPIIDERVAPPPTNDGWDFRFATSDTVKGREQICSAASANAQVAWDRITAEPRA